MSKDKFWLMTTPMPLCYESQRHPDPLHYEYTFGLVLTGCMKRNRSYIKIQPENLMYVFVSQIVVL